MTFFSYLNIITACFQALSSEAAILLRECLWYLPVSPAIEMEMAVLPSRRALMTRAYWKYPMRNVRVLADKFQLAPAWGKAHWTHRQ